ncbi:E3 ubiquitin-protein ligase MBR2 [Zea mays]|uniref:E3 ubiquitin-protein ligase MBR2 n=1 Tax=Zea mays TaxID=4577 RepID=A0A1D6J483_MAIZE|nr:E3 ubiquitin-protein ligase MBR2 [Zea mays]
MLYLPGRLRGRRGLGQTGLWSRLPHRMHQTMAGYKKCVPNLQENSTGRLRHGCIFPP